jgi:hypothetical protein
MKYIYFLLQQPGCQSGSWLVWLGLQSGRLSFVLILLRLHGQVLLYVPRCNIPRNFQIPITMATNEDGKSLTRFTDAPVTGVVTQNYTNDLPNLPVELQCLWSPLPMTGRLRCNWIFFYTNNNTSVIEDWDLVAAVQLLIKSVNCEGWYQVFQVDQNVHSSPRILKLQHL